MASVVTGELGVEIQLLDSRPEITNNQYLTDTGLVASSFRTQFGGSLYS